MVHLQELPEDYASDHHSDSICDEEEFGFEDESLLERLIALKEVIPQPVRTAAGKFASLCKSGSVLVGKAAWVVSTSAFLLILPLAFELEREQMQMAYENEQKQQQTAQQVRPGLHIRLPKC